MTGQPLTLLRPATSEEKAVVNWLLLHAATRPEAKDLLSQVAELQVVGSCGCGCPSIDFEVRGQSESAGIVADAIGLDAQGNQVGALLWWQDGHVSGLEVYSLGGSGQWFLPRLESLQPWPSA